MLDAEVIVIGGGPAGCATALHLARRGRSVIVVDRSFFPRPKVCGEGLMPHGVAELRRLATLDGLIARPFVGIRYVVDGRTAEGRFTTGPGLGFRRSRFDVWLQERCAAAGVDLRCGTTVTGLERVGNQSVVRGPDLRARVVVVADGMRSRLRTQLGLARAPRGRPRYGLRAHLRLPRGVDLPRWVEVRVGAGLEAYITPVEPRVINVALLLERGRARELKGGLHEGFTRMWMEMAGTEPLGDALPEGDVALTGPLRQEARDVVADGVVLVGDAAGFLDGITGEGMSIALESARLAAAVLDRALTMGDLSARALRPYRVERARQLRLRRWLTRVVLRGIRHRALARATVGMLGRHPRLFGALLAMNDGAGLRALLRGRGR